MQACRCRCGIIGIEALKGSEGCRLPSLTAVRSWSTDFKTKTNESLYKRCCTYLEGLPAGDTSEVGGEEHERTVMKNGRGRRCRKMSYVKSLGVREATRLGLSRKVRLELRGDDERMEEEGSCVESFPFLSKVGAY